MNLHETLTNSRLIAHAVPVAFDQRQEEARRPALAARKLMARSRHHALLIGIAVLVGVLLLPAGASAAATTCDSRNMLDAAANGRAITQHTPACYRRVLAGLPSDLDSYLPAVRANILQAMHRDATLDAPVSAQRNARSTQSVVGSSAAVAPAVAIGVRGPVTSLLEGLGPAHVDQVPLPVVALGGGAALLLLAGLGTSLARVRSRRPVR
jgi:hypothetical protein